MEGLESIIGNMFLMDLGKEEQNILMELTGEQFVMILISTLQQLMFFVDHLIQDLEPLAGQTFKVCLIAEAKTFQMAFKNQF